MIAYESQPWHDLFTAAAGAAATLAGLIFVAVSLNHELILKQAALPAMAARSLSVLVGLVIASMLGLAPGQDSRALGTEILILGVLLLAGAIGTTLRAINSETRLMWKISLLSVALFSTAPMVIGGISVLGRADGGLYWVLAENGLRPGGIHLLRMDPANRNTTVTARAGYARAVTARTELVLSKPEVNHNDEGSETYFEDPDGHLLEIITRPYGSPTRLRRQTLSHRQTPGNAGPPALHERIVDNLCTSVPGPPRPQEGDDSEQES